MEFIDVSDIISNLQNHGDISFIELTSIENYCKYLVDAIFDDKREEFKNFILKNKKLIDIIFQRARYIIYSKKYPDISYDQIVLNLGLLVEVEEKEIISFDEAFNLIMWYFDRLKENIIKDEYPPILVKKRSDGKFFVMEGSHRCCCCLKLNKKVKAFIIN